MAASPLYVIFLFTMTSLISCSYLLPHAIAIIFLPHTWCAVFEDGEYRGFPSIRCVRQAVSAMSAAAMTCAPRLFSEPNQHASGTAPARTACVNPRAPAAARYRVRARAGGFQLRVRIYTCVPLCGWLHTTSDHYPHHLLHAASARPPAKPSQAHSISLIER